MKNKPVPALYFYYFTAINSGTGLFFIKQNLHVCSKTIIMEESVARPDIGVGKSL